MNSNGISAINVFTENEIPLINKLFKSEIEKFLEISHLSVILITPDKEAYIASASKKFSDQYKKLDLHKYDNTMSELMYDNLDFYTWTEGYIKIRQTEIATIKKSFRLNNGTVFVRRIDSHILLYCVATQKEDPIMKTIFVNYANSILQIGDYMYSEIKMSLEEYLNGFQLPVINKFEPFLQREIPCLISYERKRKEKIISIINQGRKKPNLKIIDGGKFTRNL
jgi:hypothetical protein